MKNGFSTPGFLWPLLTLLCLIIILTGLRVGLKRLYMEQSTKNRIFFTVFAAIGCWIAMLVLVTKTGFFADFKTFPPRPIIAVLMPLPFIVLAAFSQTGAKIIKIIPGQWFIYMQFFRVLVEVLIWFGFMANKLPVQMTFEGLNFDILTGIAAIPVGYYYLKNRYRARRMVIGFNIAGLLLLFIIIAITVFSMPTSLRFFMNEPDSGAVGTLPIIFLPGVLVPMAYAMHIFSVRKIALDRNESVISMQKMASRNERLKHPERVHLER